MQRVRVLLVAALGAMCLVSSFATTAGAAPRTATDWFAGTAVIAPGQTSPVQINPSDLVWRADGAVGLGYTYRATGKATGQLPGAFTYEEHGYIYFGSDSTTMVGSRFVSGEFLLSPARGGPVQRIADTSPETYTSGVQTVPSKFEPLIRRSLGKLIVNPGPLTYGYFTFTNTEGAFIGYATPDFTRFAIQITFPVV